MPDELPPFPKHMVDAFNELAELESISEELRKEMIRIARSRDITEAIQFRDVLNELAERKDLLRTKNMEALFSFSRKHG